MSILEPLKITHTRKFYVLKLKNKEIYFNTMGNIFYTFKTLKEYDSINVHTYPIDEATVWLEKSAYNKNNDLEALKAFITIRSHLKTLFDIIEIDATTNIEYKRKIV